MTAPIDYKIKWDFKGTDEESIQDKSGNGNHLVKTGTPIRVAGHDGTLNSAYQTDETNFLQKLGIAFMTVEHSWSMCFWMKLIPGGGVMSLILGNKETQAGLLGVDSALSDTLFNIGFRGFGGMTTVESKPDGWHHIGLVFDSTNPTKLKVYTDGQFNNEITSAGEITTSPDLFITGGEGEYQSYGDFFIFDRAITGTEYADIYAGMPKLANPTFSPEAGFEFSDLMELEINASLIPGVGHPWIYATTDGSTPDENSIYVGADPGQTYVWLTQTCTVKAIAILQGYESSDVVEATYTRLPNSQKPTITPAAGTYSDTTTVTITAPAGSEVTVFYTTNGNTPTYDSTNFTGIKEIEVADNMTIKAFALQSGYSSSEIVTVEYIIDGSIPEPVINVESGTYIGSVTIEMSTEEGDIYYTLNGSDPDESDMLYENPITISRSVVLKAVSISNGVSSEILTRIYYIEGGDIGMEENQSSGLIIIGWTPEGDTKETILGEVPADGQEILSIQETINYFKTKYAGEYPTEGRVVAGAATFTVDLIESPTLRGLLSNTSVVSGTKTIIGLNSGAKAKTGKLRLHPMYAGADKSEDITILRAAPAVTDERTYSADGKKLMKVVFTVMGVKTALGTPAATDFTAHMNTAGIKVKMVNANDLGVSIASAAGDAINDATNVVTFTPGIGANRAIFFKSSDNFATAANTSYYEPTADEIKAGSFAPGTVTWTTLTALTDIPTEATGYYYKAIEIGV